MTGYPVGRIRASDVRRFADKHPAAVALQQLDRAIWLADYTGDALASVSVQAFPAGLTIAGATFSGTTLRWFASAGSYGTDYGIVISFTTTAGRAQVEVWQCLVTDPLAAAPAPTTLTFAQQMALFLGTLPTSPAGLTTGTLWNNGGSFSIAP